MKLQENRGTILVADDELEVREYLDMALRCLGYTVELAQDGEEVINLLARADSIVSAVLLDIMMPRMDGIATLREIRRINRQLPVIVISGASSTGDVVTAMKSGGTDFLSKPLVLEDLQKALTRAVEIRPDVRPVALTPAPTPKTSVFLGNSRRMRELHSLVEQIGMSGAPVLIQGETGSGKEVFARELHANSARASKIFLKLNCAALPSELVESELFGFERGAFTGAFQKRAGMFEMANGGTLLLDEIGDMDVRLQAKLLQVLQDHEFQRIGGKEVIKVDVRIVSATHRDLDTAMAEKTFREDLFFRLNVINVQLPPLRERTEDIIPLAEFLLQKHSPPGLPFPPITPVLMQALMTYHWPGNVRELENVIRRLIAIRDPELLVHELLGRAGPRRAISVADKPAAVTEKPKEVEPEPEGEKAPIWELVKKAKRQTEADAIVAALDSARWNRKQAAALLQIDYKALLYKMKRLGIKDTSHISYPAPSRELLMVASSGRRV